jgi:single-strand DNA-binding protein
MSSLNQVNLIGRVGGDPEVRHLPNGDAVANLSLATSESWKDKQTGEKKEATEWHRITFYGKLAEIVKQYVTKGSLLYIGGSLKTRQWEKDGQKHYTTEIKADEMKMLGGKSDGQSGAGAGGQSRPAPQQAARPAQQPAASPSPAQGPADKYDDDIPFAPIGLQEGRNFLHMI